jgi:hypothetical protein
MPQISQNQLRTKNAKSYYKWLVYHSQTKSYVKCPKDDNTRHTALHNLGIFLKNYVMFFSAVYKLVLNNYQSVYARMSSRKRQQQDTGPGSESKRLIKAPEIDTCIYPVETTISPLFDPNKVLLRCY